MQAAKFQRLYILLRPCAHGGGGYARLEQARGKYTMTVNAHGFSPSEEGIRVLLAAREEGGGSAVCDLGALPISSKGQSSLKREIAAAPGGLPLSSYSALCIAKEWPTPKLLLIGALEDNSSLSTYFIGETVCKYLAVPTDSAGAASAEQGVPVKTAASAPKAPALQVAPEKDASVEAQIPAAAITPSALRNPGGIPVSPTVSNSPAVFSSAVPVIGGTVPVKADPLPDIFPREPLPFPTPKAGPAPKPASEPAPVRNAPPLRTDDASGGPDPAIFTAAAERTIFPPDIPAAGTVQSRPPVTALPRLHWPNAVKELENYFSTYPPYAPFDAPGWRFVQVPMAAGSTIPYYAVGMLARDGKVTQVAYAVPGDRGALPPPGFSGYRWQQGRNGQGYWTLWKRA